jgi:hypothetical protein
MPLLFSTTSQALDTTHTAVAEAGQSLIWWSVIPTTTTRPYDLRSVMPGKQHSGTDLDGPLGLRRSFDANVTAGPHDEGDSAVSYSTDENGVSVKANVSEANVKQSDRNYKVIRMKRNWNDERWRDCIIRIATEYQVDPHLITAIIHSESNFNHQAISPKGALGLMQVMPQTGERFGFKELFDPENNIRAGTAYLKWLLVRFEDDVTLALAAYNAGENAVLRYRGVPPYKETQNYVAKVLRGYNKYEYVAHHLAPKQHPVMQATKSSADKDHISQQSIKLMTDMVHVLEQAARVWVTPIQ